jgi:hypothetical protein
VAGGEPGGGARPPRRQREAGAPHPQQQPPQQPQLSVETKNIAIVPPMGRSAIAPPHRLAGKQALSRERMGSGRRPASRNCPALLDSPLRGIGGWDGWAWGWLQMRAAQQEAEEMRDKAEALRRELAQAAHSLHFPNVRVPKRASYIPGRHSQAQGHSDWARGDTNRVQPEFRQFYAAGQGDRRPGPGNA